MSNVTKERVTKLLYFVLGILLIIAFYWFAGDGCVELTDGRTYGTCP